MSTGMALEFTRDWLRDKYGWNYTNCGVHFDAVPPLECASPFYISIDDGGVESDDSDTDSLKEIVSIRVGIWRKPEHLHQDLRGMMKLPNDLYVFGTKTLEMIERQIVVHKSATAYEKHGLHRNYQFVNALNTRYNLPEELLGDKFKHPFRYRGKGQMEELGMVGKTGVQTWLGWRLRFRGLSRTQKMRLGTDPIG